MKLSTKILACSGFCAHASRTMRVGTVQTLTRSACSGILWAGVSAVSMTALMTTFHSFWG